MFRLTFYIYMTGKCSHKQTPKSPYLALLKPLHPKLSGTQLQEITKNNNCTFYGSKIGYQTNHAFGCIWTIWSNPIINFRCLDEKSALKGFLQGDESHGRQPLNPRENDGGKFIS